MAAPQRAPNVFELRNENEQLRRQLSDSDQRLAERDQRIAELETRLALTKPQAGERQSFDPEGLWESKLGAARKLMCHVIHNAARENEGYCSFTDSELGRRTGTDRAAAARTREALTRLKWVDCVGYDPGTGVRTFYVRKAAEAWKAIRLKPGTSEWQHVMFGLDADGGSAVGSASPVGSSESHVGRMAPGDAIERGAERPATQPAVPPASLERDEDGPPSIAGEVRRLLAESSEGVTFRRTKVTPPSDALQKSPSELEGEAVTFVSGGVTFRRTKVTPPAAETVPDDGRASLPRACTRPGGTSTNALNTNSSFKARISESSRSSSCPAQDPARLGEATPGIVAEALDVAAQGRRGAAIEELMAELIRIGGVAPNGPLKHHGARQIATAVVAGSLDWHADVVRLLDEGAALVLKGKCAAPFVYLLGTVDQILIDRERPPIFKGKPKPR